MNKIFDIARHNQGFRDQKHLDAFFAYYDHTTNCLECRKPGPAAIIDDGYQPTHMLCDVARKLDSAILTA